MHFSDSGSEIIAHSANLSSRLLSVSVLRNSQPSQPQIDNTILTFNFLSSSLLPLLSPSQPSYRLETWHYTLSMIIMECACERVYGLLLPSAVQPIPIQLSSYFLPASSSHTCPIASFSDDILTNLFPRAPLPLVSHFVTIWPTWPGHERCHWRPVMADLCSPFIRVIASYALQQVLFFLSCA